MKAAYAHRYGDQPLDWKTRLAGVGGTAGVGAIILFLGIFTWKVTAPPLVSTSDPLVLEVAPLAAPPEPVREVAVGEPQVERQQNQAEPQPEQVPDITPVPMPPIPSPISRSAPQPRPYQPPVERGPSAPMDAAPPSIAAPPAQRSSSEVDADWTARVLAHLERHRRYPARARAAGQEGIVTIRFTVNRQGRVLSSQIVRKSRFFTIDSAALEALKQAQPLPTIPAELPDQMELTLPVEFSLKG